jgi:hypothetical protein
MTFNLLARIGHDWALRCFGSDHVTNTPERALRCLEEAVELAQALGVPMDTAKLCVDTVYKRPVGDPDQEIGGVLHTVAILCEATDRNGAELHEREVRRVLNKPPKDYAARNQEKLDLGLRVPPDRNFESFQVPGPFGREWHYRIDGVHVTGEEYKRRKARAGRI